MRLPRGVYIALIVICTDLILIAAAALILLPTGLLAALPVYPLVFLYAWKTLIVVGMLIFGARWNWGDQLLGFGGYYMGRFVGLVLGGIIGGKYAGIVGAIVLAIVGYFFVSRLGRRISLALHAQGMRLGLMAPIATAPEPAALPAWLDWFPHAYCIGVPMLFALISVALHEWGIGAGVIGDQYLPLARLVLITYSLVAMLILWMVLRRAAGYPSNDPRARRISLLVLGMAVSSTLAMWGSVLVIAFGASPVEAIIFALASIAAGLWWISLFGRHPFRDASA
jgi:hypothetical protein